MNETKHEIVMDNGRYHLRSYVKIPLSTACKILFGNPEADVWLEIDTRCAPISLGLEQMWINGEKSSARISIGEEKRAKRVIEYFVGEEHEIRLRRGEEMEKEVDKLLKKISAKVINEKWDKVGSLPYPKYYYRLRKRK